MHLLAQENASAPSQFLVLPAACVNALQGARQQTVVKAHDRPGLGKNGAARGSSPMEAARCTLQTKGSTFSAARRMAASAWALAMPPMLNQSTNSVMPKRRFIWLSLATQVAGSSAMHAPYSCSLSKER